MKQPREIIGDEAMTELAFHGWQVVPIFEKRDQPSKPLTHDFEPHSKYPWFCKRCGYAPHEVLMHTQKEGLSDAQ